MKKKNNTGLLMVDKSIFFISFTLLLFSTVRCRKEIHESSKPMAPSTTTFQKTYGGLNNEYIGNVQQTNDSGYVIIGTTRSFGAGDEDIYVIKVNTQGNIQWTKTYGTLSMEEGYNIRQTKDGGYILSGVGDASENYILIKADAEGNMQWSKSYAYFGPGNNYDVQLTDDGGYIIVGPASSVAGAFCIKTDVNGNILWCNKYSGGKGVSIAKTIDGGYAILGDGETGYGCCGSTQLTKIDLNGNVLWSKSYRGADHPLSMKKTTDGGFIITGMTSLNYNTGSNYDVYVIKTDSSGNQIWLKTYGGATFDGAWEIEETADDGYIFSGVTGNFGEGHVLVIKTDSIGKVTWSKIFDGGKAPFSYVHQAKDGGFIVASQTAAFGAGGSDLYLIKTDSNGNVGCYENSFSPQVTAPVTQETNTFVNISTGSIYFDIVLISGTGGIESKLCYK